MALWGYFLNLVSLAALVVGPASGIASHSGMLGADRGARGKRLAGGGARMRALGHRGPEEGGRYRRHADPAEAAGRTASSVPSLS